MLQDAEKASTAEEDPELELLQKVSSHVCTRLAANRHIFTLLTSS